MTDVLVNPAQLIGILDECQQSLSNLAHTRGDASPNWLGTHATRAAVKAARATIVAADNRIGEWGDLPHILQWHRDPNREPAHIRTESADGKVWEAKVTDIKIGSGFNADGSLPDDTALHFWVQFLCPFLRSHTKVLSSAAGAFDFLDRTGDDQTAATERMRAQAADWADCCRVASEIIRTAVRGGGTKGRGDEAADDWRPAATVNDRMKAELASNLDTVKGWTARQWANHLNCSVSSIGDAQTWKELELLRKNTKAEKAMDRHRKSKPIKRR